MKITVWHGCKVMAVLDLFDSDNTPHDKVAIGEISIDPWARLAGTVNSDGSHRVPTEFS